jgi:hypothetical protein
MTIYSRMAKCNVEMGSSRKAKAWLIGVEPVEQIKLRVHQLVCEERSDETIERKE